MSVVTDWTTDKAQRFGQGDLRFRHDLHTRPMFDDAGLERVLDLYPRERHDRGPAAGRRHVRPHLAQPAPGGRGRA